MATPKPTTKNSPAVKVGKNPNNKPAESYDKRGTSVADSKAATGHTMRDPNTLPANEVTPSTVAMNVSIGNKDRGPKTDGIETRGNGAATKGRIARGPMA